MNQAASAEMPRYKCHKEVWALKIERIEYHPTNAGATMIPEDKRYASFPVRQDYLDKHKPKEGGYFVAYEGGYLSYSPAKAFEDGYTLIDQAALEPSAFYKSRGG